MRAVGDGRGMNLWVGTWRSDVLYARVGVPYMCNDTLVFSMCGVRGNSMERERHMDKNMFSYLQWRLEYCELDECVSVRLSRCMLIRFLSMFSLIFAFNTRATVIIIRLVVLPFYHPVVVSLTAIATTAIHATNGLDMYAGF